MLYTGNWTRVCSLNYSNAAYSAARPSRAAQCGLKLVSKMNSKNVALSQFQCGMVFEMDHMRSTSDCVILMNNISLLPSYAEVLIET